MSTRSLLLSSAIPLLWLGKLVPRVPAPGRNTALAAYLSLLVVFLVGLASREGRGGPQLWSWQPKWIPLGLLAGCVLFILGGLGYAFSQRVLGLAPPSEASLLSNSFDLRFALLAFSAVCAAVVEESVFRGWLLESLHCWPDWSAALATSVLFAAYHLSLFQIVPTLILGLGLAVLVLRTGSVWPAVIAHGFFNALGLVLTTMRPSTLSAG